MDSSAGLRALQAPIKEIATKPLRKPLLLP